MAKQFTLGKNERLKSRKLIEQLFSEGKKFVVSPFRIFYLLNQSPEPALRFGVGAGSRRFKKAVDRNRIKRLIREAWRLQKKNLEEKIRSGNIQLNIFFVYTGNSLPEYEEVYKKMGIVLHKMDKLIVQ